MSVSAQIEIAAPPEEVRRVVSLKTPPYVFFSSASLDILVYWTSLTPNGTKTHNNLSTFISGHLARI